MPLRLTDNIKSVLAELTELERKQVPYGASVALNTVAFDTRSFIVNRLWPNSFPMAKNRRFPAVLFRVEKARKTRLQSTVYQSLDRDYIETHIKGGTKRPHQARNLAIPVHARRTSSGRIRKSDAPRSRNTFLADFKGRGPAIFKRQGPRHLVLMFVLRPTVHLRAAFPFYEKGYDYGESRWPLAFERAMARALATANR